MNSRRIRQTSTRAEVVSLRRGLKRLLIPAHYSNHGEVWTELGYMLNRAPAERVERVVRASLADADPLARALELLAKGGRNA